jgi:hypothetical protein
MRYWTKEKAISELRRVRKDGPKPYCRVDSAARRNFGSWSNAIIAAGVEPSRRKWWRDVIASQIQERVKSGNSLKAKDAENINLSTASRRFFGSWPIALEAAGVTKHKKKRGTKS